MDRARQHNIVQGECLVVDHPEAMISTILGSCVAACLRDPVAAVGGMNHFLLPGTSADQDSLRYGAYAMELLINRLLGRGARRDRLEARLFGGGRLLNGLTDIGRQNGAFAERFLKDEAIANLGGSLGGDYARRIQFWPVSGRIRQQRLDNQQQVFAAERPVRSAPIGNDLELFDA